MTEASGQYQPRTGDGSIAAEDDSLLRQPADETYDDPDVAPADAPAYDPAREDDQDFDPQEEAGHPSQPAEGPDDPAYTGEDRHA